jgi:hypothetical protein
MVCKRTAGALPYLCHRPTERRARSSMRESERGRRLYKEVLRSPHVPLQAVLTANDGSESDKRRCTGRSPVDCTLQWKKINAACNAFHCFFNRVEAFLWTGSPSRDDLIRADIALKNVVVQWSSVLRNSKYAIGPPFKYLSVYDYLMTNTPFITGSESAAHTTVAEYDGNNIRTANVNRKSVDNFQARIVRTAEELLTTALRTNPAA